MTSRTLSSLVAVAALLVGGCTIEQDLTPRIDAAGAEGSQGDPSEGPSQEPSEQPSPDVSEEPSEDPSPEVTVPGNTPPAAAADAATTSEDAAVVIDVLSNDRDPDGDPLTPSVPASPGRGTATVTGDKIRYVPDPNVTGTDRFTYTIKDGRGGTATATVSVTIAPVNDPPVAVDDQLTTPEDTTVTIDVLANDVDVDGDALSIASVGTPSRGTARVTAGKVVYDPAGDATGKDSFTYTVRDPSGATDRATVTVDVGGRNDAPIARDDSASTAEDREVTIDVLGNDDDPDGDAVAIASVGTPGKGTATPSGGQITYTPDPDVNGTDTFTYTVRDPSGTTDTAKVTVSISPVNDPPVASGDSLTVAEDSGATSKNVVANDRDPDGDRLTVAGVTQPSLGRVTFSGANVTFTPNSNANGSTSFTYTVSDGSGTTDTATVDVTITPVSDAPAAEDDGPIKVNTCQDARLPVLANDGDVDGDALSIVSVTQPATGSLTVSADSRSLRWNSGDSRHGSYSATYTVSDGTLTDTASVTLDINACPIARDDLTGWRHWDSTTRSFNVISGAGTSGGTGGASRDSDPDNAEVNGSPGVWLIAFRQVSGAGTISCDTNGRRLDPGGAGSCTYTPASCAADRLVFDYTIRDRDGAQDTARVTVEYDCIP